MGFTVLSVGSPSTNNGFSLSANTSEWQLGRQTNIKIQGKQELLTGRCLQPTQKSIGLFWHNCWVTDWQARWRWRHTESWHMQVTHMWIHLYNGSLHTFTDIHTHTHTCMHSTLPHNSSVCLHSSHIFLGGHEWRSTHGFFVHCVIEFNTNPKWHSHLSGLPVNLLSWCVHLTKWPQCFSQAAHSWLSKEHQRTNL